MTQAVRNSQEKAKADAKAKRFSQILILNPG